MKKINQLLALILACLMIYSGIPFTGMGIQASALNVGSDADGPRVITEIRFIKQHVGFNVTGGNLLIFGTNLKDLPVLVELSGGIPQTAGTLSADSSDFFLNYVLSAGEATTFTGKIFTGGQTIDLDTPNFPNITGADKIEVNQTAIGEAANLTINGSNLMALDDVGITAKYGTGISSNNIVSTPPASNTSYTFTPTAPSIKGFQDITLAQTKTTTDPKIVVQYYYANAFRIVEDLNLGNLTMYPNAAAKGDVVRFTSDSTFNSSSTYAVYFLDDLSGDFGFADFNKALNVNLSLDRKTLSATVPAGTALALGSKKVVIVSLENNQIVARYNHVDRLNIIDATYKPTVSVINPSKGSDLGTNVQIKGRKLVSIDIPELISSGTVTSAMPLLADKLAEFTYSTAGASYKGVDLTALKRTIKVIIGKQAFFEKTGTQVKYDKGADDYLYVRTDSIDDAAVDPFKDVIIEIETTIVDQNNITFVFSQAVTIADGFEFIPSSLLPEVTKVIPDKINITSANKLKENTQFAIYGDSFLVNKFTDPTGVVHVNYPVVLFQITNTIGDTVGNYLLKFDKNDTSGYIRDKDGNPYMISGVPMKAQMIILNSKNEEVDGTVGNEVGTKILMTIPNIVDMLPGKKNIQIINPKRESDDLGEALVVLDIVDFVNASDVPVIESVVPNIVTSDSKEEVIITGSNFQAGAKVIIDGVEMLGVVRALDAQGNKSTLTFKTPVGRVSATQLQVVNPLGGIAVWDFYYVQSFNQDPKITAIAPNRGTIDTLVTVSGDNFLKPDPTVLTTQGMDAFKLLGSRLMLDNKDVNTYTRDAYGSVEFAPYVSPPSGATALPILSVNLFNKLKLSPFADNAVISLGAEVMKLVMDQEGNPAISDGNRIIYVIQYNGATLQGFDASGTAVGGVTITPQSILVDGKTFVVETDNNIIRISRDTEENYFADFSNYWYGLILKDVLDDNLYVLEKGVDGVLKLTDGQTNTFKIISNPANSGFIATNALGTAYALTVTDTFVEIPTLGIKLSLLTPYTVDATTKEITGNKAQVFNKSKMTFRVPILSTGTGFKDVAVENPDTKRATVKGGFYYVHLPASRPVLSQVVPERGSVAGGYVVKLFGREFEATSKVYVDGLLIPAAQTVVDLTGRILEVIMPRYPIDLSTVFGIDHISVPIVIVNGDGGSASKENAFTYVTPASQPRLDELRINSGSTNGGELVELIGYDFRYFEPYQDLVGGPGYDAGGDTFTDLNTQLNVVKKWDNISTSYTDLDKTTGDPIDLREPTVFPNSGNFLGYTEYYGSLILPKVYFGSTEAKIVDYGTGYLKVVTPVHRAGDVKVTVVNNDSGVSNGIVYTYKASNPIIKNINPNQGAKTGYQVRDIYGSGLAQSLVAGYMNNDATTPVDVMSRVRALVRFGAITNRTIAIGQANDGRINANRATVILEGGLRVEYDGALRTLRMTIEENGKQYTRVFSNYDGRAMMLPAGMLMNGSEFYQPNNFGFTPITTYNTDTDYELIQVEVDAVAKRFFVERGYAPIVTFDNSTHVQVRTPSYYTVDTVPLSYFNPDRGEAKSTFKYTNPSSKPIVQMINPAEVIPPGSVENDTAIEQFMVQATIKGGIDIEIKGHDFRENAKVYIGSKLAQVLDITYDDINDLEVIIVKVPTGIDGDIGAKYPIIVENEDGGIANTTDINNLGTDKRLIYFIYRKPLSVPTITDISPKLTSQFGGNTVTINGKDFRAGAIVIIGSIGGVPVTPFFIESVGRVIKIIIPGILSPGLKDIQVINKDFGTSTLNGALTIVSYPTVNPDIRSENGSEAVTWVSVEGGTKIRLYGTNFQSGAKVIFGGTRVLESAAKGAGEKGYFKDDKFYLIQGGAISPKVEFVDATTLVVTVPEVFEEKSYAITVINPDFGLSDNNASIAYSVPIPSNPTNLTLQVINNQYIKLYDYTSMNAEYFEIYVYLGSKTTASLISNAHKDFKWLGTTSVEPYKITKLDGLTALSSSESLRVVIRAVNKYGPSGWSNIASLSYTDVKNMDFVGEADDDGGLQVDASQGVNITKTGTVVETVVANSDAVGNLIIDYAKSGFGDDLSFKLLVPEIAVTRSLSSLFMNFAKLYLSMGYSSLNTLEFSKINQVNSGITYGYLDLKALNSSTSANVVSSIPRTLKQISSIYQISIGAKGGTLSYSSASFAKAVNLQMKYDEALLGGLPESRIGLYEYVSATNTWRKVIAIQDSTQNMIFATLTKPGIYTLMATR
jgi:hypothetical protein